MSTRKFSSVSALFPVMLLVCGQVYAKPTNTFTVADEGRQTLTDLRHSARIVANEADKLRMAIVRPDVSPEMISWRLEQLKSEINDMGKEMKGIQEESEALPSWQQHAIEKTFPLLQKAANNTESAIDYFNANRSYLWSDTNRAYADRLYDASKQMAEELGNYLHYAKLRNQQDRLAGELSQSRSGLDL